MLYSFFNSNYQDMSGPIRADGSADKLGRDGAATIFLETCAMSQVASCPMPENLTRHAACMLTLS
jgi:hypothetical protein